MKCVVYVELGYYHKCLLSLYRDPTKYVVFVGYAFV